MVIRKGRCILSSRNNIASSYPLLIKGAPRAIDSTNTRVNVVVDEDMARREKPAGEGTYTVTAGDSSDGPR